MLTDQDMTLLKKTFASKGDLIALEKRIMSKVRTEMKNQFAIHLSPIVSNLRAVMEKQNQQDEKFDHIMNIADRIFAPIDDLRLENAVSAAQYKRQVEWNHKVAKKVDVPFDY